MKSESESGRSCRFCGDEVTSRVPEVDFCRFCFYQGRPLQEHMRGVIDRLTEVTGQPWNTHHTGGGCFSLMSFVQVGELLWAIYVGGGDGPLSGTDDPDDVESWGFETVEYDTGDPIEVNWARAGDLSLDELCDRVKDALKHLEAV